MLIPTLLVLLASFGLIRFWNSLWWRPRKIEAVLKQQGLKGPAPLFFVGNTAQEFDMRIAQRDEGMKSSEITHDIVGQVTPEITKWSALYGKPFISRWLEHPRITIFDPESFKEVMSKQFHNFIKSEGQLNLVLDFIGYGLIATNGEEWSHRRSVLSSAFHSQKLKGMVPSVEKCVDNLISGWKSRLAGGETELEITQDLKKLAADVISHTAFGSNYEKGEIVFEGLNALGLLLTKLYSSTAWIPFFRYYPTALNREIWRVRTRIDKVLLNLIAERRNGVKSGAMSSFGSDLLGLILEESEKQGNKLRFNDKILVDECKTFYLAGQETTASLMGWAMFLLAVYPDWQARARDEIQQHGFQDWESLSKLKLVGMILNESMRLYPVVSETQRSAANDTVLNGLKVPAGTEVTIPILSIHHDPELWGPDVHEFNPERFAEGAAKACPKHANAFLPFVIGPRVCIGQQFALMEAKMAVAKLLNSFSFKISPNYKHNPTLQIVVIAAHGIQLLVEEL